MFINFTNHPSERWDEKQIFEANRYGDIVDIPFPNISPELGESEIHELSIKYVDDITSLIGADDKHSAVMVQGEFTLSYGVISGLKKHGIRTLSACTERVVEEMINDRGETEKKSIFRFVRFREYL